MEITEVRVNLTQQMKGKLRAFCSIIIDNAFVVDDLKIIEGVKGIFVAMPSRKAIGRCGKCGGRNSVASKFCCDCGAKLEFNLKGKDMDNKAKAYIDIAYPLNDQMRTIIQQKVLQAYEDKLGYSKQSGYKAIKIEEPPPGTHTG